MSLVAFGEEEQIVINGEPLTLRLDFRAITIMEGALESDMPSIVANFRSGRPQLSVLGQMLWAVLREHHSEVTLDQAAGIMFDKDAAKVGFALDALIEKAFPMAEGRKPKNPPQKKKDGRSKSFATAG